MLYEFAGKRLDGLDLRAPSKNFVVDYKAVHVCLSIRNQRVGILSYFPDSDIYEIYVVFFYELFIAFKKCIGLFSGNEIFLEEIGRLWIRVLQKTHRNSHGRISAYRFGIDQWGEALFQFPAQDFPQVACSRCLEDDFT